MVLLRKPWNEEEIPSALVRLPPPKEQAEISALIDIQIERFDAIASEAQGAIDVLQERRIARISATVTGRIDVSLASERRAV